MGVSLRSFSEGVHSPHLPIKAVALKEWAVIIDGLARGEQLLLVRKGGIQEETREFRLEETSFYLYPTYEHQRRDLIKPEHHQALERTQSAADHAPPGQVTFTHLAHVVDDITVKEDPSVLAKLDRYHRMTHDYAAERLRWQSDKALHILVVRAYKLTEPKTIDVLDEYLGCKSWVTLQEELRDFDLEPVLEDEAFHAKRCEIFAALELNEPAPEANK
ncbi:MAG TPA: DUF1802 family protein [Bacilli bacterium]|nr:DUF1802 family protein [Bacilli bacterium]